LGSRSASAQRHVDDGEKCTDESDENNEDGRDEGEEQGEEEEEEKERGWRPAQSTTAHQSSSKAAARASHTTLALACNGRSAELSDRNSRGAPMSEIETEEEEEEEEEDTREEGEIGVH
jgi:hypothetical protein